MMPAYEAGNTLGASQWETSNQAEIPETTSQVSPCSQLYSQHRAQNQATQDSFRFPPSANDRREGVKMADRDVLGWNPSLPMV